MISITVFFRVTLKIHTNKNILALFTNFLKGKKVIKRHKQSNILHWVEKAWFAHEQTTCPASHYTDSESLFTDLFKKYIKKKAQFKIEKVFVIPV